MAHKRDRGYRWTDRDPDMENIAGLVSASELSVRAICERVASASGGAYKVSDGTIYNWLSGKTRRPQNFTLHWVAFALGYVREWRKM